MKKRHGYTTVPEKQQQQQQQPPHWYSDFIYIHSEDIVWWMGDLCFGGELIFSSNRIMCLLLFPIQSVTISFVQDQVAGTLLMCPRDTAYEIHTHTHILTLKQKATVVGSV